MSPKGPTSALEPLQALYLAPEPAAAKVTDDPDVTAPRSRTSRGVPMPPELEALHDGPLGLPLRADRPTIVANFVTTLDGVVALDRTGATGGGEISGFSRADRFQMGLLRALADVVLVAAGTVRAAPTHEWTPRRVARAQAALLEAWRADLGLARQPTTVIVTASGALDPRHPGLSATDVPVVVATTTSGARQLGSSSFQPQVRVEAVAEGESVSTADLVGLLGRLEARVVVCEGGPHLLGELLAAGLVDELFLSLAPQLVGRSPDQARLALVEGRAFDADHAPWGELRSVHRAGRLLLLRYRLT
ncbi:MAG TPA: dihydrofolate reductase family protein [Candidatus Limnocylindrales bacterium]|nr:dihydrofolate reductase family protein [Candidatus Limnocylindrales bacterium]